MRRIRPHLTYANVMVTLLAFVVLGGTAFAITLGRNVIESRNIAPGAVHTSDMGDGSVKPSKLGFALGNEGVQLPKANVPDGTSHTFTGGVRVQAGPGPSQFLGVGAVQVSNPSVPGTGTASAHVIIAVLRKAGELNGGTFVADVPDGATMEIPVAFTHGEAGPGPVGYQLKASATGADVTINGGTYTGTTLPVVQ